MPVTSNQHDNSIELTESMSTSQLAYYRDLQSSTLAFSWPYTTESSSNIHYRFQPLAINQAILHFAQREALTRAFLSLYDQRSYLDGYKSSSYSPPGRDEEKPKQSYVRLIGEAILNSPDKKLVLSEIYKTIQTKYPYFKNRGSGWKNSIRHNLSLNDCFVKLGRSPNGKGHFWTLSPQHYEEFLRGSSHQRKFQKKAAPKYCYYPREVFQFNNYAMVESPEGTERPSHYPVVESPPSVLERRSEVRSSLSPSYTAVESSLYYPACESPPNLLQRRPEGMAHGSPSPHYPVVENQETVDSPQPVSEVDGRTEIHIPGDEIQVKHEVVISSEEETVKPLTCRPFDVENLLASHPTRPTTC